MATEDGGAGKLLAKAGLAGCALLVFLSGYYAMRTDDWVKIAASTAVALVAGVLASAFARRAR
jgi:hypothetical protein